MSHYAIAEAGERSGRSTVVGLRGFAVAVVLASLVGVCALAVPASAASSTEVLSGVSCLGKVCVAVGSTSNSGGSGVVIRSANYGVTWAAQKAPTVAQALNGISCIGKPQKCIAVGDNASGGPLIAASPTSGSKWTAKVAPKADGELTAVTCQSTENCWVGGYSSGDAAGAMADTSNGGTTWTPESVPGGTTGVSQVNGVACKGASTVHCYATGAWVHYFQYPYLMHSTSKETSWTDIPVETTSVGSLTGIWCIGTTDCVAVGTVNSAAYILVTTNGTTWTPETAPAGFSRLTGVSCPTSTDCFAVGALTGGQAGIAATVNGGTTWTAQTAPAGAGGMSSISCTTALHCVAVGTLVAGGPAISATTNGGTQWSAETPPAA